MALNRSASQRFHMSANEVGGPEATPSPCSTSGPVANAHVANQAAMYTLIRVANQTTAEGRSGQARMRSTRPVVVGPFGCSVSTATLARYTTGLPIHDKAVS